MNLGDATVTVVTYKRRHKIIILIASAIVISIALVLISMTMYVSSGTIQLDLSRPGYISVSDQAGVSDKPLTNFPQFGAVDGDSLNSFEKQLTDQAKKAKAVEAFSGDPLDPRSLGLDEPQN